MAEWWMSEADVWLTHAHWNATWEESAFWIEFRWGLEQLMGPKTDAEIQADAARRLMRG